MVIEQNYPLVVDELLLKLDQNNTGGTTITAQTYPVTVGGVKHKVVFWSRW